MLKWIIGDFLTGSISEAAELPVVRNSDSVTVDINSTDSATLRLSRKDLPSDFKSYLREGYKIVALVDTEASWDQAVLFAGTIWKQEPKLRDTVTIQVTSLKKYFSKRSFSTVNTGTLTNPNGVTAVTGASWRNIVGNVVVSAFTLPTPVPADYPSIPAVLGNIDSDSGSATMVYRILNTEFLNHADVLDEIRDERSPSGNEYRFVPRWASSAKDKIVWDVKIGSDAQPHINENAEVPISLSNEDWKPLTWGESRSAENLSTRLIGQSKAGDEAAATGADFTVKYSAGSSKILYDEHFNPGVELTQAELDAQLDARLTSGATADRTAYFERAFSTTQELRNILSYLGYMAAFSGSGIADGYGTTMRIVGIDFNASQKKVSIALMQKAARYPKLPRDRGNGRKDDPIIPRIPPNQPVPEGGGDTPVIPPFEIPNFEESNILSVDGYNKMYPANINPGNSYPTMKLKSIRDYNEWIYGLDLTNCAVFSPILETSATPPANAWTALSATSSSTSAQLKGYNLLTNAVFNSNLVASDNQSLVAADKTIYGNTNTGASAVRNWNVGIALPAVAIKALAFPFNDSEMIISGTTANEYVVTPESGPGTFGVKSFPLAGGAQSVDFSMMVSADWVYLTALYCISNCLFVAGSATLSIPQYKYKVKENTWRIPRNSNGTLGTTWQDLGSIFSVEKDGSQFKFWSPGNTYIIGDKIYGITGYFIKDKVTTNGELVVRSSPNFFAKDYKYTILKMNLDGTGKEIINPESLEFADLGPNSANLAYVDSWMQVRQNLLATRVRGDQVVVSYEQGFTNRREYLYASINDFKFSKVMDITKGPVTKLTGGLELQKEIQGGLGPEIIGQNVIDILPGGDLRLTGVATTEGITNRHLMTIRGKLGFTDTVSSTQTFGDCTYSFPSAGVSGGNQGPLLLHGATRNANHVFAAGGFIRAMMPRQVWYVGSGEYRPRYDTRITANAWYMNTHLHVDGERYQVDGPVDGSLSPVEFWTKGQVGPIRYTQFSNNPVNGGGRAMTSDFWWKYLNGKIYMFADHTPSKGGNTAGNSYVRTWFTKMTVDTSRLT